MEKDNCSIDNLVDNQNKEPVILNSPISIGDFLEENQLLETFSFLKEKAYTLDESLEYLITQNNNLAMYGLIQIFGNDRILEYFNWRMPNEADIRSMKKYISICSCFGALYCWLFEVLRNKKLKFKGIENTGVYDLSFSEYLAAYEAHRERIKKKKANKKKYSINKKSRPIDRGKLYNVFEYGLSDW